MRVLFAVAASLFAALLLTGCDGSQGQQALNRSLTAYDSGNYQESLTLASQANASASSTKDSLESAYIAGMSAYRLGQHAEAVKWLEEPARSDDRWMAGQANVTMGSSLLSLGRRNEAARTFVKAAERLDGEEARKARLAAANAYREVGDKRASDEQFRLAGATPPSSSPSSGGTPSVGGSSSPKAVADTSGPFVLQAGAFRDREKAERRASEVRSKATKAGMGEPRVTTKRGPDGATLYVVQFGSFNDRRSADAALTRLGVSGVVVGRPVA